MMVSLLEFGHAWGIRALALGAVGGSVLEAAILAWHMRRLGFSLTPRWKGWTPAMIDLMRQYGSVVVGAALMSSALLVDQAMAAMLGSGSVAALNYGGKVVSFLLVVGSTALGTAALPHFSRLVAASDWPAIRRTLRGSIGLILCVGVPLAALTMWLSRPLVQAIFLRGAFTSTDVETVSRVQVLLLLQVPFYLIGILLVRLISSLQANSILLWGCVVNFALNIVLNYVLMQWLQVAGIALATSIVMMVSSGYLGLMLMRVLNRRECEQIQTASTLVEGQGLDLSARQVLLDAREASP
jgi:putative peptidoglycan lipid II flippase